MDTKVSCRNHPTNCNLSVLPHVKIINRARNSVFIKLKHNKLENYRKYLKSSAQFCFNCRPVVQMPELPWNISWQKPTGNSYSSCSSSSDGNGGGSSNKLFKWTQDMATDGRRQRGEGGNVGGRVGWKRQDETQHRGNWPKLRNVSTFSR